jgi:REP element-mobilizing transposase RayT
MANTYTKIYLQFVFAVKHRQAIIPPDFQERLNTYIGGIVTNQGQKNLIVNGVEDHIHLFVGINKANINLSEFVNVIKTNSSKWINETGIIPQKFQWQEGYGAFSYSASHIDNVYKYVENQQIHHQKTTFKKEYIGLLKAFDIDYDEKYLFDFFDYTE